MLIATYIFNKSDYHIHKRFRLLILSPLSYLIKTIGLDCDEKKKKTKLQSEKVMRGPNEKFTLLLWRYLKRNERIKKNKLKKKHHEEVEEAV
ncbi:MAG TPA: hypothetical protein VN026_04790 [Bacteroidia bacterium]|jgi:hypothetical protein|nr:hypothetical protein [Bacteroidia bacterium]